MAYFWKMFIVCVWFYCVIVTVVFLFHGFLLFVFSHFAIIVSFFCIYESFVCSMSFNAVAYAYVCVYAYFCVGVRVGVLWCLWNFLLCRGFFLLCKFFVFSSLWHSELILFRWKNIEKCAMHGLVAVVIIRIFHELRNRCFVNVW